MNLFMIIIIFHLCFFIIFYLFFRWILIDFFIFIFFIVWVNGLQKLKSKVVMKNWSLIMIWYTLNFLSLKTIYNFI